ALPGLAFTSELGLGFYRQGVSTLVHAGGGVAQTLFAGGITVGSGHRISWGSNTPLDTPDVLLVRASANTLALRNGTAAQVFFLGATDAQGSMRMGAVVHASLGSPADGTQTYCSDCTFANPCASGGTGAIAKRLAGAWRCD
ncbi:MAG: hypothetical protein ACRDHF_13145, partial [Tepidiformaceae bacterium]